MLWLRVSGGGAGSGLGGVWPEGLNFAPIFSPVLSNTLDSISVAGFRLILTSLVFVPL